MPRSCLWPRDTDTRVDSMHAKKMTALVQAEAKDGWIKTRPIPLRIESKAGHGGREARDEADRGVYGSVRVSVWQLGIRDQYSVLGKNRKARSILDFSGNAPFFQRTRKDGVTDPLDTRSYSPCAQSPVGFPR
jgi:hypothetical protein